MKTDKLIKELQRDCCDNEQYCPIGEITKHFIFNRQREMVQLKIVEKYKFIRSKDEGKDIGWNNALQEWSDKGYAAKFAEIYNEDLSITEIFNKIFNTK
jgi:hypothetical protein